MPIVMADEGRLVLAYWEIDNPPYEPTTAPLAVVSFERPHLHLFGPPDENTISDHPLSSRGLHPGGAFRVEHSSFLRKLELEVLTHYIFCFHDSTFECVAGSYNWAVIHVGLDEEHIRTLEFFRRVPLS